MHIYPESLSPPKKSSSKDSNFTSPARKVLLMMFMKGAA